MIAVVSVAVCAAAYGLDLNRAAKCSSQRGLVDYTGFWRETARFFRKRSVFNLLIELYTGRHSLVRISQVHSLESLSVRHGFNIYNINSIH